MTPLSRFSPSFKVEIRAPLSSVQSGWNLAHGSILGRWSRIWTMNTLWARKGTFFTKNQRFCFSTLLKKLLPWQHLRLLSTENYFKWYSNYTKNQKVPSALCKPFWDSKAKTFSLNRLKEIDEYTFHTMFPYELNEMFVKKATHFPWRERTLRPCSQVPG